MLIKYPFPQKLNISLDNKTINFEVKSFDLSGKEMKNAYKPIILFINEKRERILRYHTKYFDQYDPHSKLCETDAKVEFLKNDGSYDRVYVETNGNKKKGLTKPMDITSTKYKFTYQKRQMEIKFDLECLIQVNTQEPPYIIVI